MRLIKIKNTGADASWLGQTITTSSYYTLQNDVEINNWGDDSEVYEDISNGVLVVNNGADTIDDLTAFNGWKYLATDILPISTLDGKKLAVHSSAKPDIDGSETFAVWTGSGDHPTTGMICQGDLMDFSMVPGTSSVTVDVKFNQMMNGRVWVHEGYLKFENGGSGDYMDSEVVGEATPLQQSVNLDLEITDDYISYAAGGAGTGTHGFADATKIVLLPRPFSNDGEWDYDGVNLTPNVTTTGGYKISSVEQIVHRYINKIPCRGSCATYFSMTSDETTEILKNYYLRVTAHNVSDTTWNACVIMEIYRERTYNP